MSAETQTSEEEVKDEVTIESIASEQGWAPKDDWRGDPEDWRDAATFLREGARIQKESSNSARKSKRELEELRERMDQLAENTTKLIKNSVEAERSRWEAERQQAFDEQDTEKFNKADKKLKELDVPEPSVDPRAAAFERAEKALYEDYPILNEDEDLKIEAYAASNAIIAANKDVTPEKWAEKIVQRVKRMYPEKFDSTLKRPNVGGSKGSGSSKKGGKFDDLPADAKRAFEEIQNYHPSYTKEQHAKAYFEETD